jgi:hypothetical protein
MLLKEPNEENNITSRLGDCCAIIPTVLHGRGYCFLNLSTAILVLAATVLYTSDSTNNDIKLYN